MLTALDSGTDVCPSDFAALGSVAQRDGGVADDCDPTDSSEYHARAEYGFGQCCSFAGLGHVFGTSCAGGQRPHGSEVTTWQRLSMPRYSMICAIH